MAAKHIHYASIRVCSETVKMIVSALIGILLGILGARVLFVGSWHSLIPWGIAGLLLGFWSETRKGMLANGIIYGFFLSFSFMIAGYNGTESTISRLPFFAIIGLVGAVCGLMAALAGRIARRFVIGGTK